MGWAAFFGYFLLGAGPLVVAYGFTVARKSFLVLLSLGRWGLGGLWVICGCSD